MYEVNGEVKRIDCETCYFTIEKKIKRAKRETAKDSFSVFLLCNKKRSPWKRQNGARQKDQRCFCSTRIRQNVRHVC